MTNLTTTNYNEKEKALFELMDYQLIKLIEERMDTLSEMTGYSSTSIARITGWSDETTMHHKLRKLLTTVKYEGVTKEDMVKVYVSLENVTKAWEAKGY